MDLLEIMQTFKDKYLSFSTSSLDLSIDYFYITKGDGLSPDSNATTSAERLIQKAKEHMSKASVEFHFINARKLLDQVNVRVTKVSGATSKAARRGRVKTGQ